MPKIQVQILLLYYCVMLLDLCNLEGGSCGVVCRSVAHECMNGSLWFKNREYPANKSFIRI